MKKLSITLLLALASLVFVSTGCKKVNCTELALEVTNAEYAYLLDQSDANCKAFADAISKYVDKCTIANKAYYDALLEDLPCAK